MRLTSEGYSIVTAERQGRTAGTASGKSGSEVTSDLTAHEDEMDGMQLFTEIQKVQPGMPVIIRAARFHSDAVAATRKNVFSFLTKPIDETRYIKR